MVSHKFHLAGEGYGGPTSNTRRLPWNQSLHHVDELSPYATGNRIVIRNSSTAFPVVTWIQGLCSITVYVLDITGRETN